ncbi:MAG: patatin-like phospholipase family protein [Calditrichia bacterium]
MKRLPITNLFITLFVVLTTPSLFADSTTFEIHLERDAKPHPHIEGLNYHSPQKKRLALALSGGGARGFVHVGVLLALEEYNIPVDMIVGTSMGSIIGGLYAAGYSPEEIQQLASKINWEEIFADQTFREQQFLSQKSIPRRHLIQVRLAGLAPEIPSSISHGQQIFQTLYNRVLNAEFQAIENFDDLRIPFRAVATNLITGEKAVISHGNVAEAINASLAFPLLFAPVAMNGQLLVDGGISENLPVLAALEEGADRVIAVDATSDLRSAKDIALPWQIADQVTSIMMNEPTEVSRNAAAIVIRPDFAQYKSGSFGAVDSLIRIGYEATVRQIDDIRTAVPVYDEVKKQNVAGTVAELRCNGGADSLFAALRSNLKLRVGEAFSQSTVLEDLRTLDGSGFLEDVFARVTRDSNVVAVELVLHPFPKVKTVRYRHNGYLPDSLLKETTEFLAGKRLHMPTVKKRLELLQRYLVGRGYSFTTFEELRFNRESGELYIRIDEGIIDEIIVTGNDVTRDFVVLREFPLVKGAVFRAKPALRGIKNIYGTSLFHRVTMQLDSQNGTKRLTLAVKERRYLLTRLGANYSLDRKSDAFAELVGDNFLGTATKASLFGSIGDFQRSWEARFYTVRLFRSFFTAEARFYYKERIDRIYENFERQNDYLLTRRGGRFSIGQQIDRLGLISAELRLESINVEPDQAPLPNRADFRLRTFTLRSVVDKRDRLPFPTKGIYNRWSWETGNQSLLGSTTSFSKIFVGLEGYYPFWERFNYHPYFRAGSADLTLPFSEFFFLGGRQNFRGLVEHELFGRQFVQGGVDIRYTPSLNLPFETFVIANYALGAAWRRPDDRILRTDFLHSFSGSLVINSLLGPLELSYSRLVGKRNQLYFSLGFDF